MKTKLDIKLNIVKWNSALSGYGGVIMCSQAFLEELRVLWITRSTETSKDSSATLQLQHPGTL